jgi:hypothetical protein
MRRLRLLVPIAVIVALVLLLIAPAGALAAPDSHRGGHGGRDGGWGGWGGRTSCDFSYRVRWGDTIGDIAWRFGVNSTCLSRANRLRNPNRIYAGQYLWIPCGCRW